MNKNDSKGNCLTKKLPTNQFLRIMRISIILLFTCVFCSVAESVYTQNAKVTINKRNVTMKEVLNEIEAQTDYLFIYNDEVNIDKKVSVKAKSESVKDVLNDIFKGTNIRYSMEGNHIILFVKSDEESPKEVESLVVQQQQQKRTVTGKVTDPNGQPLPGASIVVKGTTQGTVTDAEGNYSLSNIPEDATLVFSFVGMQTQEIKVGNRTRIDLTMQEDAIGLEEVVAIGYGVAKKKDLTGAVVSIDADEVSRYQPASVSELLRASAAGLKVNYSTDAKGTPDFFIRGDVTIKSIKDDERAQIEANKPLLVVDGIIFNGDLTEINVNDVESIEVLKDASAASIYGSRAANGVVVIETKKGRSEKPVIRAGIRVGVVTPGKMLKTHKAGDDVMSWLTDVYEAINDLSQAPWSKFDKFEKLPDEYKNDWLKINGIPGETDPAVITSVWLNNFNFEPSEKENYLLGREFDWEDFLFRNGLRQKYDLSVSGRSGKTTYYLSMGYINNESIQLCEEFSSVISRLNLDVAATDFLNIGINANFSWQDEGPVPIGYSGSGTGYRTGSPYDSPWDNVVYNENIPTIGHLPNRYPREYLKVAGAGSNRGNPYLNPAYTHRKYEGWKILPTIYGKLTFPYGIIFTSNFTPYFSFRKRLYFEEGDCPSWAHGGKASREEDQIYQWQWDNILNWDQEFGKHRVSFTGLVNAERYQSWYTMAQASNFSPTDVLGYHGLDYGLIPIVRSNDEVVTRNALMGRLNYSYENRYNLSTSIRRDGYSRFGKNKKYAVFPSVSAGWTITNENFMAERPDWLSFVKFRASWGINGNSSGLGPYAAYALLSSRKYLNYDKGYINVPYITFDRMANEDLAWEKVSAFNVGIDYGLWNGRLRGALDVYSSTTSDLLLDKKLPILTGFDYVTTNVGKLKNQGFDFSVKTINIENKDFRWSSDLNVSYDDNKIVSLTGQKLEFTDDKGHIYYKEPDDIDNGWFIGKNKDIIWDYKYAGVYQIGEEKEAAKYGLFPGDFKIIDQDGNGVINSKDKVFQGLKMSPWYLTFTNNFEFKGFDLGIILLAKLGYKGGTIEPFNNEDSYIKNHNWWDLPYWTPNNPINNAARINSISLGDAQVWQSKSYLRLQNISCGYNLPLRWLNFLKVNQARVAITCENVAVWTKWLEGDPEDRFETPRVFSFEISFSL